MRNSERLVRGRPRYLLKLRRMGTQRGQIIGFLPWLVRWTSRAGKIDFCPAFVVLVSPVRGIIFLTVHFFTLFVLIAQQPGQAGLLGRLSLAESDLKSWMID
jgi:hypothetical protein